VRADETFFRESGVGPGVVCLHSNASSSSQWKSLMERLAPDFHVMAPDGHGAGKGPPWPTDRALTLSDEVALLEPVFARAGQTLALVGHSYGAAVALLAAVRCPERVGALVLYEPTLFGLIDAESSPPNEADGIREAVDGAAAALAVGNRSVAAERFIDYWTGAGSWRAMRESQRGAIESSIVNVAGWGRALFAEPTRLAAFAGLKMPVLLMAGKQSRPSALGVVRRLARVIPRVELVEFEGVGHMGPITDPARINDAIDEFLRRHAFGSASSGEPIGNSHRDPLAG
jgi:pimeloyl-ACP methyl ester carboxylesterase